MQFISKKCDKHCVIRVPSSERYAGANDDKRIDGSNFYRLRFDGNLGDRTHRAMRRPCCGMYDAPADSPAAVWFYRMQGEDWDRTGDTFARARMRYLEKYYHGPKRKDTRYVKRHRPSANAEATAVDVLLTLTAVNGGL